MKIERIKVPIRDLVDGYKNCEEEGVFGYGGRLNIRPAFQREFIYSDKQQNEVIRTILKKFPLNIMYWTKNDDGNFELLDGQQRTLSICEFVDGQQELKLKNENNVWYHNLSKERRDIILNYELDVYLCEGDHDEKIEWFEIINIAGMVLFPQEILNAVYSGEWLYHAKKYFSKQNCPAQRIASEYMSGTPIRQDYLETTLKWISGNNIRSYMAKHQHDNNADEIKQYFVDVFEWVKDVFDESSRSKYMKGVPWGELYNEFKDEKLQIKKINNDVKKYLNDDEVTSKKGIYSYVLKGVGNENLLTLRTFDEKTKEKVYKQQKGYCVVCRKHFDYNKMEADHIIPWSKGGKTEISNCQMLCVEHNRKKGGK